MEHSCIRQTELPNVTRLFSDFIYHPDRVKDFYPFLPVSSDTFQRTAKSIRFSDERRARLIEALSVQNAGNPLLRALAKPGTVAVVTGQQVGLFSGPLYTIYKALTAIRLAEQLSAEGIPAVPMFWLATEDHDFHEVNQAWAFDAHHQAIRFEAAASPAANQVVGGVVLEDVPLDELRATLQGLPFADEAFEMVRDSYSPGATFGAAFGALLVRLLKGFPILQVDPMLPAFRTLAAPLLQDAVARAPQLIQELRERDHALIEAGYHAQVHVEDSTSLVFLLKDGVRTPLRYQDGFYVAGKEKYAAEELALRGHDLSPNALLRPVVQDSMIPTIAYVGGPAELAYLAQSEVLYRELLGRQPVAVHRAGFTLVDHHAGKLLDRYRLQLTDFFGRPEAVGEKASAMLVNPGMVSTIEESRAVAMASLERMASGLVHFDPSSSKALDKSRRKIAYQFEKIERKVKREALVRDERATCDVEALKSELFPRHKLQERLYSSIALVAKYGPDLAARVYEHVTMGCPDHQLLTL